MSLFGKFSFFKEDSVIPDFVRSWFDSLLPISIVICVGWIVVLIMNIDIYNIILSIFMPLCGFMGTPYGFVLLKQLWAVTTNRVEFHSLYPVS